MIHSLFVQFQTSAAQGTRLSKGRVADTRLTGRRQRPFFASAVVVAALVSVFAATGYAPPATAHLILAAGKNPFLVDDNLIGAGTTWGVIVNDNGQWLRTCEEATGHGFIHWAHRVSAERILVGTEAGIVSTSDLCDYTILEGSSADYSVTRLVQRGSVLYAIGSRPGFGSRTYKSTNGGQSFVPTGLLRTELFFNIEMSSDGAIQFVAGMRAEDQRAVLAASVDNGEHFLDVPVDLSGFAFVKLLAMEQDSVIAVGQSSAGDATLVRIAVGDDTVTVLGEFTGEYLVGHAILGSERFVLTNDRVVKKAADLSSTSFAVVPSAPPLTCLEKVEGKDQIAGCGEVKEDGSGFHFYFSDDGVDFVGALPFDGVAERVCPVGTDARTACARYFSDGGVVDSGALPPVDAAGGGGEDGGVVGDGGAEPTPQCACTQTTASPAIAVVVLWLMFTARLSKNRRHRAGSHAGTR
jgi:hypothetical protein